MTQESQLSEEQVREALHCVEGQQRCPDRRHFGDKECECHKKLVQALRQSQERVRELEAIIQIINDAPALRRHGDYGLCAGNDSCINCKARSLIPESVRKLREAEQEVILAARKIDRLPHDVAWNDLYFALANLDRVRKEVEFAKKFLRKPGGREVG